MYSTSYRELEVKLKDFIKKYYLQKIIKGILSLGLIFIPIYLITTTLEYNFYFNPQIRTLIFWGGLVLFLALFSYWILIPAFYLFNVKKQLDQKQAANIIGNHFPEIQDKLTNVLMLKEMHTDHQSNDLILASIEQKAKNLKIVKFSEAIDWARNRKLLKYVSIPAVLLLLIGLIFPTFLSESTNRLIHYNQIFEKKAPFDFVLLSKSLKVYQYNDIEISAKFEGKNIPTQMSILVDGISQKMSETSKGIYSIKLPSIAKKTPFRLESVGFYSPEYVIDILPKPILNSTEIEIYPPAYTLLPHTTQKDIGDISAPEGSTIVWKFKTDHIDALNIVMGGLKYPAQKFSNGFGLKKSLLNIQQYTIQYTNHSSDKIDSLSYAVSLTPDAHPNIFVQEFNDSIQGIKYYAGDVSDDYKVVKLQVVIEAPNKRTHYDIPFTSAKNSSFSFSMRKLVAQYPKGSKLNYYFLVWDNDAVHGSKSTKSDMFTYQVLTDRQVEKQIDAQSNEIKNDLSKAIESAKKFQKETEDLKKKMLEKKNLDYNDKKQVENLLEKQKELQKQLEQTKEELKRNFDKKNNLTEQEKNILEKQKLLEELLEQIKNPELNQLLQKMEEMLQKMDKNELLNQMEKMDEKNDKLEKELDRMLNLYKNLDYQQKVNDAIDKLDQLAKDQERLSKESEMDKNTLEKQKELGQKTEEIKQDIDKLKKMSEELKKGAKEDLEEALQDIKDAEKDMDKAEEELKDNDKKEGSKNQKSASEKLEKSKSKLNKLKKKQKKKEKAEDARMMRRLLENIVYLSFEQEKLIDLSAKISTQSPSYPKLFQTQQKLKEDFAMVEDSLYKLAARQSVVKKMIFEEVDKINSNTKSAIKYLTDRNPQIAISKEQFAMASYNNLGLMISESLKKMQEEEDENESDIEGGEMCDNPKPSKKKGKPSAMKLAQMQQQLNEQMENLKKQMEGKKDGKMGKDGKEGKEGQFGKDGNSGQNGDKGMNEQIAKIAAQQQAIRNALKQLENSKNQPDKSGKKPLGNQLEDAMKKMEQTEKELVNKQFYNEMLKRQKDIEVKLLEAAKAERQQDEEKERESKSTQDIVPPLPPELQKYLDKKRELSNQQKKEPVGLTPYFKSLVEKYYKLIR